nr:hypothetical protein [Bacteroidaceae bacterium]
MQNLQLCRTCPHKGCSIAHKVMEDTVAFYLENGGPDVAKANIEILSNVLKFYGGECKAAYCGAMGKIKQTEKAEQEQAEKRRQEQFQQMLSAFSSIKTESSLRSPISNKTAKQGDGPLPAKLSTEKAMLMWQRLQQAGMIDDHYQPVGLSRAQMAVIADEMMALLSDENEKLAGISNRWTWFQTLWGKKNLRIDHY